MNEMKQMANWVIVELQRKSPNWTKVVEDIVRIEKKIFPKHESLARSFDEELKKRNSGLLYSEIDGGDVAGYVMYSSPSSLSASIAKLAVVNALPATMLEGSICNLSTPPRAEKCRGQGHGEALLKAAIQKCRTRSVHRISLHVDPSRAPAMTLYKKLGFRVDNLIEGYYSPDRNAYRMYLDFDGTGTHICTAVRIPGRPNTRRVRQIHLGTSWVRHGYSIGTPSHASLSSPTPQPTTLQITRIQIARERDRSPVRVCGDGDSPELKRGDEAVMVKWRQLQQWWLSQSIGHSRSAMGRMARSCVQSMLKLVNSLIGLVGIAMILYGLWMIRDWHRHTHDGPSPFGSNTPAPWFMYTFLSLGVTLCVITCSGHIAAETVNGCCLYCYMAFVFLLLVLEAAVTGDVFLNHNWEEDFPVDPTGNFNEFKHFVRKNFEMCKWIGLSVVWMVVRWSRSRSTVGQMVVVVRRCHGAMVARPERAAKDAPNREEKVELRVADLEKGLCMLLAMILKALGPHPERCYDSDDDYTPDRVPLLKNYVQPHYVVGDPIYRSKNDSWNVRINDKVKV
ncbi:hypothetical protein TEA_008851 [Camellia sinensis var. sinensis]|uniref:N-acetyltransferase domain-containing protein n=1 Tax=Camellia sinensis var. sinensis TaxID=542762 RepID=A0A4S4DA17_CAMSN|nr:hypothetical protein TEA_008851 [Camellia sinensis var. sinensis]